MDGRYGLYRVIEYFHPEAVRLLYPFIYNGRGDGSGFPFILLIFTFRTDYFIDFTGCFTQGGQEETFPFCFMREETVDWVCMA